MPTRLRAAAPVARLLARRALESRPARRPATSGNPAHPQTVRSANSSSPGTLIAITALLLGSTWSAARAADSTPWPTGELSLNLSDGVAAEAARGQPVDEPQPPTTDQAAVPTVPVFGRAGTQWLSFGIGACWDFGPNTDAMANIAWSLFLADRLEFRMEFGGWYFIQEGDNTGAVSWELMLHYHLWHADDFRWTIFGEVGIGLLAGFDNIPDGGTGLDFAPRVGAGFTHLLDDKGTRLEVGARWRHLSNGRFQGDVNNPARDSLMIFAGVIVPF